MGFIEETGVAQLFRDARITPIYEGTTGIQANDLSGASSRATAAARRRRSSRRCASSGGALAEELEPGRRRRACSRPPSTPSSRAVKYVVSHYGKDMRGVSAGAVPLLELFGIVAGGWQLLRSALVARERLASPPAQGAADPSFYRAKIDTARFYAHHVLPQAPGARACHHRGCCRGARRGRAVAASLPPLDGLLDSYPQRIVCLTEEPTEVLYALGRGAAHRRHFRLHRATRAGAAREAAGSPPSPAPRWTGSSSSSRIS